MKSPLLSIIVPVYNSESYLEACLTSIRNQTFSDYEVWLIDDGSKDASIAICDDFADNDSRFHVIHKINEGVSIARNTGLKRAEGEWICFIDSDDTIEPGYLETLYNAGKEYPDYLIVQGYNEIENNRFTKARLFEDELFDQTNLGQTFEKYNINRCGFPFGKLYNHALIQSIGLQFAEQISYAEDVLFMLTYLAHAKGIKTVSGANYNYFILPGSLSKSIYNFESEYACYARYNELIQRIKQQFNIPDESLHGAYHVISEYLIRRAVGSLYQPKTRKPQKERLALLKRISAAQIQFTETYYTHAGWYHKITLLLLSRKMYYLCDLFTGSLVNMRELKNQLKH